MSDQPNLRKEEHDDRDEERRCEGCGSGWSGTVKSVAIWALVIAAVCYLSYLEMTF